MTTNKIFFETERFLIRELSLDDVDGIFKMESDPDVHTYLGKKPIKTKEEAMAAIEFVRQQYISNGIGRWAIIDKKTGDFVGWTGFKLITESINNHINYYDIGYRLRKEYWGKGIATETATAALKYGFENLNTETIYSFADCNNIASNKILEKIGMTRKEKFIYDGVDHYWYEIAKGESL